MTSRQHIVFILMDQLRADALGCYGGDAVPTPNLDRLAGEGRMFTNVVSSSPLCVPARTSLLTGMSAPANGVIDNLHFVRPDHRELGIATWPQLLSEQGYRTVSVGKMHFYPWDASLGFQERIICEDKTWADIHDDFSDLLASVGRRKLRSLEMPTVGHPLAVVNPNPRELTVDGFVGDQACRVIAEHDPNRPLAMMVGFPGPHDPYDPRAESLERVDRERISPPISVPSGIERLQEAKRRVYRNTAGLGEVDYGAIHDDEEAERVVRHHYSALVAEIDDEVGRILDGLDAAGMAENTLVVVASDHGDQLGDHGLAIGKRTFFEPSIRVPLILRSPSISSGIDNRLFDLRDVTATLLAAAGVPVPSYMDSFDLAGQTAGRECILGALLDGVMMFDGRWKLHRYVTGESLLHDLETDPQEQRNRISDPDARDVAVVLDGLLTEHLLGEFQRSVSDRRAAATILDMVRDGEEFGRRGWKRPWPNQQV